MKIVNGWICQVEQQNIKPVFGDIEFEDGKISAVTPTDFNNWLTQKTEADKTNDNIMDAAGRVIMLPNVNFHEHFYSRLAKGLNFAGPMDSFLHILENLWWKLDLALDEPMVAASVKMGALESLKNGVTYTFDHHASPNFTTNSLALISSTLADFGMRGVLCFETSDRNGMDKAKEAIDENARFFAKHSNDDFKAMLGLHASFTLSDQTLKQTYDVLQNTGMGIHIHLCEGLYDRTASETQFADAPLQRLKKFNLLNDKSVLSHAIHLSPEDRAMFAGEGCVIAYNPDSNMNNAVGLPAFDKLNAQVPVICGTDGMHADPIKSMKQLFLLGRHLGQSFEHVFPWFQKIYFDQLEFVRKYYPDFSSLQVNDRADLVVWDYVPPTPLTADNFWGHYVYGITERQAHSVVQQGRFLLRNQQLTEVNEESINREIYTQGARLAQLF